MDNKISEFFGCMVFNDDVMRERLPREVYKSLTKTIATGRTIDPSIADKCIVYYTDIRVYNGHYKWASEIIAKNFRVVSWGDDNW